ncbi:unnamed protein product [Lymnaea stagnalis]|uniref:Uncharacterized protein n=1 Tax=Lymnaea stagnalis TaxID=6523 RepID=A0AAV2I0A4_LYMST
MTVVLVTLHLLTAIPRKSQHSALIAKYTSYAAIRSYTVLSLLDLLTFFYLGIFFLVMCACCSVYRGEAYRRMFEIEDVTNASESSLATATRLMNTHLRQVAAVWSTEEFQAVNSATSVGGDDDIMARFLRLSQDYGAIIENFELNPYVMTFSNPNESTPDKGKTVDSVRALNTSPINEKEISQTSANVKTGTDVDSRKSIAAKAMRLKELIRERNKSKQQERLIAREKKRCEMMKEWHKQGTWL